MRYSVPAILVASAVGLFAGAGTASGADASSPAPEQGRGSGWSETHLHPEAGLRRQIERALAFLGDGSSGLEGGVAQLKAEGVLDRRASSRIRNALDHARDSLAELTKALEGEQPLDGWTARMIAYELGMAGDALVEQAKPIEDGLRTAAGGDAEGDGGPAEMEQAGQLAEMLRGGSKLLKETARTIVRDLQ